VRSDPLKGNNPMITSGGPFGKMIGTTTEECATEGKTWIPSEISGTYERSSERTAKALSESLTIGFNLTRKWRELSEKRRHPLTSS